MGPLELAPCPDMPEEQALLRQLLTRAIAGFGHCLELVLATENAQEGHDLCRRSRPHLVVLDLELYHSDSIELADAIPGRGDGPVLSARRRARRLATFTTHPAGRGATLEFGHFAAMPKACQIVAGVSGLNPTSGERAKRPF